MKNGETNTAIRDLQVLFEVGSTGGLSDGQLLDRFVERSEAAVFEAIVDRHGPMVWGVCRRVLRDHHDAEDAFQATFLVLARKASSVMPPEKLGPWLYGVAYQTARKARATRAKRRMRELLVPDVPEPVEVAHDVRDDLAESLDRELSRLPEKYRIPIVLCELEEKTHGEAAEQLGWPVGTVSGRLSRARAMLARRLSRPGVSLAVGSLAVLLARDAASASMPTRLVVSTARAARLLATGQAVTAGVVSARAVVLTGEVMKAMRFTKIQTKTTTAVLLALALAGAGLWQAGTRADQKARPEDRFRVTVHEVIHDESTLVTQVGIQMLPGSKVGVIADKAKRGGFLETPPGRAEGPSQAQVVIFADHLEWKAGSTNALKFLMNFQASSGTSTMSDTGPMPKGKKLADVVTVAIQSDEYKYGESTKLVTFKDVTYSLVVRKPE